MDAAEGDRARLAGMLAEAETVNGTMSPYLLAAIEAEWAQRHGTEDLLAPDPGRLADIRQQYQDAVS